MLAGAEGYPGVVDFGDPNHSHTWLPETLGTD